MLRVFNVHAVLLKFFLIISFSSTAQVVVDSYTGAGQVAIPLTSVQSRELSVPIGLSYQGTGIRVDQFAGVVGLGWSLSTSYGITREVRGIPDDMKVQGIQGKFVKGWVTGNAAALVAAFQPANSGNAINDQDADFQAITSTFGVGNIVDTQPDLFHISLPGESPFSFFFKDSATIVTLPYVNNRILPSQDPETGAFEAFTVITESGVKYTMNVASYTESYTTEESAAEWGPFVYSFYQPYERSLFPNQGYKYRSAWHLTKALSPRGSWLQFEYIGNDVGELESSRYWPGLVNPFGLRPRGSSDSLYVVFDRRSNSTFQRLHRITSDTKEILEFNYGSRGYTDRLAQLQDIRHYIEHAGNKTLLKGFDFKYKSTTKMMFPKSPDEPGHLDPIGDGGIHWGRIWLTSVSETNGCEVLPPYEFEYYGVDFDINASYLPERRLGDQDYWGFPIDIRTNFLNVYGFINHPKIWTHFLNDERRYSMYPIPGMPYYFLGNSGGDRRTSNEFVKTGSLQKMVTPLGGSTEIIWEAHTYFERDLGFDVVGGGLRVKTVKIRDYNPNLDSLKPMDPKEATTIVRNYSYNYDNGNTSGVLVHRPNFVLPTCHYKNISEDKWLTFFDFRNGLPGEHLYHLFSLLTAESIAPNTNYGGSAVVYAEVTEETPGLGKRVWQYDRNALGNEEVVGAYQAPAQTQGPSLLWTPAQPTWAKVSPANLGGVSLKTDPIWVSSWAFPYFRHPNYDFDRRKLSKQREYNEAGQLTTEKSFTYGYVSKPGGFTTVPFLQYNIIPAYSDSTRYLDKALLYAYQQQIADIRRVLTQESTTAYDANGEALTTTIDYAFNGVNHPYFTTMTTVQPDSGIYRVKYTYLEDLNLNQNGNAGSDDEIYQELYDQHILGTPLEVVSSFQPSGGMEKVLSASLQTFQLVQGSNPEIPNMVVPDRSYAWEKGPSFAGLSFNNGTLLKDPGYIVVSRTEAVDSLGVVTEASSRMGIRGGTLYDDEYYLPLLSLYNGALEEIRYEDFDHTHQRQWNIPHTLGTNQGKSGYGRSITWGTGVNLSADIVSQGGRYLFSAWVNCPFNITLDLTVTATNASDGGTVDQQVISQPLSADKWTYVEAELDLPTLPNVQIVLSTTASLIHSDHLLVRPSDAEVSYSSYNEELLPIESTNGLGLSSRVEYDAFDRVTVQYDHQGFVRQKSAYTDRPIQEEAAIDFVILPSASGCDAGVTLQALCAEAYDLENPTSLYSLRYTFSDGSTEIQRAGTIESMVFTGPGLHKVTATLVGPNGFQVSKSRWVDLRDLDTGPDPKIFAWGVHWADWGTQGLEPDTVIWWYTLPEPRYQIQPGDYNTHFTAVIDLSAYFNGVPILVQYQWEILPWGQAGNGEVWENYTGPGNQTDEIDVGIHGYSYHMRCKVTYTLQGCQTVTKYTEPITVHNTQRTPNN